MVDYFRRKLDMFILSITYSNTHSSQLAVMTNGSSVFKHRRNKENGGLPQFY